MGVGKSTFAFSASSITVDGGSTTIGITRDNQSYSHKLLHGYGDIATLAVGTTSYTWKPTASALTKFFQEVPAQKSRQIDVYLDTYNSSTKVGRDIHALTVTLSEATGKPTVSSFAISDSNSVAKNLGIIIDGKSTLTATATPTAKYGATISKNIFTCTYNSKTYESYYINDLIASLPLTTTPTSFTIGYKSTDSRGFSTTSTLSKTIAKYQAPAIETFEVIRCDTSGNESDTGTKAKVIIKGSWAAMKVGTTYKNTATLKVGYKTKAATSYTYQTISVSAGTVNISQLLSATLTTGTDYQFSIQFADKFETYSETGIGASNVNNILYVSADGKELVIGSDNGNNVLIDSDSIDIRNGSNVVGTFTGTSTELNKGQLILSSGVDSYGNDIGKITAQNPSRLSIVSSGTYYDTNVSIYDSSFQISVDNTSSSDKTNDYVKGRMFLGAENVYGIGNGYIQGHASLEVSYDGIQDYATIDLTSDEKNGSNIRMNAKTINFNTSETIKQNGTAVSLEGHNHSGDNLTPTTINTTSTIKQNGTAVSLSGHTHSAANITSGVLSVARGGTGKSTGTFYGETVLYNNSTGSSTGTISLSSNCTNFYYLDVYGRDNDGRDCYTRVYNPVVGRRFVIMSMATGGDAYYVKSRTLKIYTATTMDTYKNSNNKYETGEVAGTGYYAIDCIKITRIVGIK